MSKNITSAYSYSAKSKRRMIGLCIERGLTRRETLSELLPLVNSQTEPMVFKMNLNGHRHALPISKQRERLWHEIGRVMVELGKVVDATEAMPEDDDSQDDDIPVVENPDGTESEVFPLPDWDSEVFPDDDSSEDEIPTPVTGGTEDQETYFVRRLDEINAWIENRATVTGTDKLDTLNLRPLLDGIRAIRQGISADAMLYSMTMHWPDDVRVEAGIRTVDFADECEPIESNGGHHFHRLAGYALKLARARVPIYFVGESGTGKSHLAKQLAILLADDNGGEPLEYNYCPMTAGATPSWLLGNVQLATEKNPDGFQPRKCLARYEDGGVFNYEEIDASDANMVLVANQLLADDEFDNPANGEKYYRHRMSVQCATGNTMMQGASMKYTGRERLDFATMDRFRMGRVPVHFDRELAVKIALAQ